MTLLVLVPHPVEPPEVWLKGTADESQTVKRRYYIRLLLLFFLDTMLMKYLSHEMSGISDSDTLLSLAANTISAKSKKVELYLEQYGKHSQEPENLMFYLTGHVGLVEPQTCPVFLCPLGFLLLFVE